MPATERIFFNRFVRTNITQNTIIVRSARTRNDSGNRPYRRRRMYTYYTENDVYATRWHSEIRTNISGVRHTTRLSGDTDDSVRDTGGDVDGGGENKRFNAARAWTQVNDRLLAPLAANAAQIASVAGRGPVPNKLNHK